MAMDPLEYLRSRCSLRRNMLTGETFYAPQDSDDWRPLSQEGRNTIILEAQQAGADVIDEVLDRFVHSTLIEEWNPAESWLNSLDEWDGTDRVTPLAQRIVTSNPDWVALFHKWMRQMVAGWTGYDIPHRDRIVPVIVGQYGFGKTSFCNILLPDELRRYYTDQVRLRATAEVHDLVTTQLLVCIDEFYQDNTDQRPLVRYLFSRSTPVFRQPYGKTVEPRRNYAAFIATTGNLHPMTDAAGAACLLCVEAGRRIDLKTPIDHAQLYAQLRAEVEDGEDYTLTDDDREHMAVNNAPFQEANNLVKMVKMLYAAAPKGKKVKATYIDAIIDRLMKEYPYWTPGEHVNQDVGFALQEAGFVRTRIHGRSAYKLVARDPRKYDFIEEPADDQKAEKDEYADNPLAKALLSGLGSLVKK